MKITYRIGLILSIIMLICLSSCSTLQLPTPGNEGDALVVVPKLRIDTRYSITPIWYSIVVVLEEINTQKKEKFILNELSEDYQYSKEIPPGKYLIKEMISLNRWKSRETYNKYLEVESGKITIFPYKFVIKIDENYYYYYFPEIEKGDMDKIITILSNEENFKLWNIKS